MPLLFFSVKELFGFKHSYLGFWYIKKDAKKYSSTDYSTRTVYISSVASHQNLKSKIIGAHAFTRWLAEARQTTMGGEPRIMTRAGPTRTHGVPLLCFQVLLLFIFYFFIQKSLLSAMYLMTNWIILLTRISGGVTSNPFNTSKTGNIR